MGWWKDAKEGHYLGIALSVTYFLPYFYTPASRRLEFNFIIYLLGSTIEFRVHVT